MGSDLYRVKVAERQDRTVKLRVEVVHPDANYLSDNESFALMMLREGTEGATAAPLAQEVSFEDTLDRVACSQLRGDARASDEETQDRNRKRKRGQRHARITLQANILGRCDTRLCRYLRGRDVARDDVTNVVKEEREAILTERHHRSRQMRGDDRDQHAILHAHPQNDEQQRRQTGPQRRKQSVMTR